MIRIPRFLPLWMAACGCTLAASGQTGFPFQDETLHYSVNWPSGLSMGDANLTAHRSGKGWDFDMTLDAGIPGYRVTDHFRSSVNLDLCALEFDRDTRHGTRKAADKSTFDYDTGMVHRAPESGVPTDLPIASHCVYDALGFVYAVRRELGQGRVMPSTQVFYGSPYSIRLEYAGAQSVKWNEKPETADRVVVHLKGTGSETKFEILYRRDPARTPLLVKIPFSVGTLTMELVP